MNIELINYGFKKKPSYANFGDAGADVYTNTTVTLPAHSTTRIPLGFGLRIPDGHMGVIFSKSSLSSKGIICENPPIDSGYTGEVHAIITNSMNSPYVFEEGDKVGQLVIMPIITPNYLSHAEIEKLGKRGTGAFGSSGK